MRSSKFLTKFVTDDLQEEIVKPASDLEKKSSEYVPDPGDHPESFNEASANEYVNANFDNSDHNHNPEQQSKVQPLSINSHGHVSNYY